MNKAPQSKKPGAAVVLVALAVVILFLMGVGLLSLGLRSRILAIRASSGIKARCAADAGLTKAVFEINEKLKVKPWDDSILPVATNEALANSDGTFSYTITGDIAGGYVVESIGKSGHSVKRVRCTLSLQGPFEFAIFGDSEVELKNSAVVDWYNYDEDDRGLQVGTNTTQPGGITLKDSATIKGDVVVGLGADPDAVIDLKSDATITGESYSLLEENELPDIVVPEWLEDLLSGGTITDGNKIGSSGKYDAINLKNDEEIEVEGNVTLYIVGDVTLDNSAGIVIDADGSLIMYIGGNFEGKNSSALNNETEDPKKLKIYGLSTCTEMLFKNSSDFYGSIYAPDAEVIFDNSADAYGAIVAEKFEQKNSAKFNYDVSLRDVSIDDEAVRFVVKQWREE